jgi:hypothetical protein
MAQSQTQLPASYSIRFNYDYTGSDSTLIIGGNPNAKADILIYKGATVIKVYEGVLPEEFYTYEFPGAASTVNDYSVTYRAYNTVTGYQETETFDVIVKEWKPEFTLPVISCKQIGELATIALSTLTFNCFQEDRALAPNNPDSEINIKFQLYYFNQDTSTWVQQGSDINVSDGSPTLEGEILAYINTNSALTDQQVSDYIKNIYVYGTTQTELWTPNTLTMCKLVVSVSNYNTTITKETVFPICGTWKIRRMSCGNYRIYNYLFNNQSYQIIDQINNTVISQGVVPGMNYVTVTFNKDSVYKVTSNGTSQWIFNFCEIENCILELQKKVLLDDHLCDACKLDKVLYQKALRLIPIYETWKKLLDKDWVYDIQYRTTDIAEELTKIYDAQELYLELKNLCTQCNDDPKKCSC